jgi:hypothetical protein
LRSVASPVEFIPPDSVVPGLSCGARGNPSILGGWGDYSPHPADQGYVLGATHMRSWAGRDSLRETTWFPGLAVCPSAGQNRQPRHYLQPVSTGDVYPPPTHNRSPPCIVIIQYTTYRVDALPPPTSGIMVAPTLLAAVRVVLNDRHPTPHSGSKVARKDRCTALQTHGFYTVSQNAPPAITVRASREGIAPLHGRTGVSQLHTIHPQPFLRFPQTCVQITR